MRLRLILGPACAMLLAACRADVRAVAAPAPTDPGVAGHEGATVPSETFRPPSGPHAPGVHGKTHAGFSPAEAKYRVLARFPNPFYCDPDSYPVAVSRDERELARQGLGALQADPEQLGAILKHNRLSRGDPYSDGDVLRIYEDHRKLTAIQLEPAGEGYRFELRVREGKALGFIVRGRVAPSGTVTVEERLPSLLSCPVCLAPGTRIATPHGPVAVADLRAGDPVWTLDDAGRRVAATVLKTARVPVHAGHRTVHLRLEDGRELRASLGHPTADGRRIDRLRVGDLVDGARVARITEDGEPIAATYDLRPSGHTGHYWANGILIGTTLSPGFESR